MQVNKKIQETEKPMINTKGTKMLILDSGPLISLTTNNLLWTIKVLSQKTGVQMAIGPAVKEELVDKPLKTKKFELEAFQVVRHIQEGTLKVLNAPDSKLVYDVLNVCNNTFEAKGNPIKIVHYAEIEAIMVAKELGTNHVAIDERTARMLIEDPEGLKNLLESRLHTKIKVNQKNLKNIKQMFKNIKVIRSTEMMLVAYKMGFFNENIQFMKSVGPIPKNKVNSAFVDGLLWGLKIRGTAISRQEIDQLKFEIDKI